MKLLHTGDWHVGKVLRGMARAEEHERVLADLVRVARDEAVDVVVVAGDLFESSVPTPDAQRIAWHALLELRRGGAEVVVIGGNHDNPDTLDATAPVFAAAGVHVVGRPRRPDEGGVIEVRARSTGERVQLALLPFTSQRSIVKAAQLMSGDAADAVVTYAERVGRLVDALANGLRDDAVRIAVTHGTIVGGVMGGGERDAQSIFEYALSSLVFPASLHYVAMGHLHRRQAIPGRCPIWYSGSPLAVDFGEQDDTKGVLVVDATVTTPAEVRFVALEGGRRLRTVRTTFEELRADASHVAETADAFRVVITGASHAGLVDDVRALLPNVLEVRVDRGDDQARFASAGERTALPSRTPAQLFSAYLADQGMADERIERLFADLLDEVSEDAR